MVWSRHYASTAGLDEAVLALAVDGDGNAYGAGRANLVGQGSEMFTLKLAAADGEILWMDHRGGSALLDDAAWAVAVGPDGDPVVSGLVIADGEVPVAVTRKLAAADGALRWEASLPEAVNDITTPGGWLAVLADGDAVLCGRAYGANGYDVVLRRYAAVDGQEVWATRYDGATHGGDEPRGMIRDGGGDLIVFGVQDVWWNYDYMVLKFAAATGDLVWTGVRYDGPPGWYDVATCAALAPDGQIIVSGLSDGSGTGWDIATLAYDTATGSPSWVHRWDGATGGTDEARDLAVAPDGMIYLTGYTYGAATGKDLWAARLTPSTASAAPWAAPATGLVRAWPNPCNPRLSLSYVRATAGPVRLAVHDARGAHVVTLVDGQRPAGEHTAVWDGRDTAGRAVAAGVYLVRLTGAEGSSGRRITLVR